jgi:hypothetical protein
MFFSDVHYPINKEDACRMQLDNLDTAAHSRMVRTHPWQLKFDFIPMFEPTCRFRLPLFHLLHLLLLHQESRQELHQEEALHNHQGTQWLP